jgi:phospholipid/cholesterol/gamma-HCH transport system substrate-binding protein
VKHSREPKWRELKIGIVCLIAIFVLVLLVIKVDRNKGIFSRDSVIAASLKDLRGLRTGSPVQFSGVEVGAVRSIEFQDDGTVVLTMAVRQTVRPFVKVSSHMSIEALGVLGDKYVYISPGKPDDPPLREGDFIDVKRNSSIFDALSDSSKAIGGIGDIVDKLNEVVERVNQGDGTVGKLINDPQVFADMQGLFSKLNQAVQNNSTLGKLANDPKLYNNFNRAASNLSALLGNMKESDTTLGRLTQDRELYDKMDKLSDQLLELSDELTGLVKDIKKRPKRYFNVSVF